MKKRTLILVLALALVFGIAVGGTIAYLTAKSEQVTNTFTVGNIKIKLEEHDDGTENGEVVTSRDDIKALPGAEIPKDPFVTVLANSEDCYVYVRVLNNMTGGAGTNMQNVATPNIDTEHWTLVDGKWDDFGYGTVLYRYYKVVELSDVDQALEPLFTTVTISSSLTAEQLATIDGKTIVLMAYAHQAANVDQDTADAAASTWAFPSGATP